MEIASQNAMGQRLNVCNLENDIGVRAKTKPDNSHLTSLGSGGGISSEIPTSMLQAARLVTPINRLANSIPAHDLRRLLTDRIKRATSLVGVKNMKMSVEDKCSLQVSTRASVLSSGMSNHPCVKEQQWILCTKAERLSSGRCSLLILAVLVKGKGKRVPSVGVVADR